MIITLNFYRRRQLLLSLVGWWSDIFSLQRTLWSRTNVKECWRFNSTIHSVVTTPWKHDRGEDIFVKCHPTMNPSFFQLSSPVSFLSVCLWPSYRHSDRKSVFSHSICSVQETQTKRVKVHMYTNSLFFSLLESSIRVQHFMYELVCLQSWVWNECRLVSPCQSLSAALSVGRQGSKRLKELKIIILLRRCSGNYE